MQRALSYDEFLNEQKNVSLMRPDDFISMIIEYNIDKIKEQLDLGMNPNVKNSDGNTALIKICLENKFSKKLFDLFIEQPGIDVNVQSTRFGISPLHGACIKNHTYAVEKLIEHSANIDDQSVTKRTALHAAAYHGNIESLILLLKAGADTSLKNDEEKTALDIALNSKYDSAEIRRNKEECAKILENPKEFLLKRKLEPSLTKPVKNSGIF